MFQQVKQPINDQTYHQEKSSGQSKIEFCSNIYENESFMLSKTPRMLINQFQKSSLKTLTQLQKPLPHSKIIDNNFSKCGDSKNKEKVLTIPVFEPQQILILLWGVIKIINQCLILLFIPFTLSFNQGSNKLAQQMEIIFISLLLFDTFVEFNLAYIERGIIVYQRDKIWKHYLKNEFFKDIFNILVLFLLVLYKNYSLAILLAVIYYYLGCSRISKTSKRIRDYLNISRKLSELLNFLKLFFIIVLLVHSFACLWYLIGSKSINFGYNSWIQQKDLVEASNIQLYNYSFFWALGFRDVSAQNDLEVCVSNCYMLVICGLLAFTINSIGISLANIQEEKGQAKKTLNLINQYMSSNQVEPKLQGRIRNYLEYCLQQEGEVDDEDIQYIVEKLSSDLRQELFKSIRGKSLEQCHVLNKTFSENALSKMLTCMETIKYSPEETLIQENTFDDFSIYMIQKGNVEVSCNGKVFQKLQSGDCFGERSFFTNQVRSCTVKALDFVKVYKITQESALKILYHPVDKEKWCCIRDSITLYEEYSLAKMSCSYCGKTNHLANGCSDLQYKPDLSTILRKNSLSDGQQRSFFVRKNIQQSSLGTHSQYQDSHSINYENNILSELNEENEHQIAVQFPINNQQSELQKNFQTNQFSPQNQPSRQLDIKQLNGSSNKKNHPDIFKSAQQQQKSQHHGGSNKLIKNTLLSNQLPLIIEEHSDLIINDIQQVSDDDQSMKNSSKQKKQNKIKINNTSRRMSLIGIQEPEPIVSYKNKLDSVQQFPQYLDDPSVNLLFNEFEIQVDEFSHIGNTDKKLKIFPTTMDNNSVQISPIKIQRRESLISSNYFLQSNQNIQFIPQLSSQNQLIDLSVLQKDKFEYLDLDQISSFDHYFPQNNCEEVLKRYNKLKEKRKQKFKSSLESLEIKQEYNENPQNLGS